jgi:hypothetical protein
MKRQGPTEYSHSPHTLQSWRGFRGMTTPGDRISTSLQPPEDGPVPIPLSMWLQEMVEALSEGVEVYCDGCGDLRPATAVLRSLQARIQASEAAIARREADTARAIVEAEGLNDEMYKRGYKDGLQALDLAREARKAREDAKERQREKRRQAAKLSAERAAADDARRRADPSDPAYDPAAPKARAEASPGPGT